MDDVRIGVVGLGHRGRFAQVVDKPGEGSQVVAVADPGERGRERGREWYARAMAYADHRELLADDSVGVVIVTSPDYTHAEIVGDALRAGKPVYVEKPLDITIERCDEMLGLARETTTRLYVGHNMRHMPVVRLMRDIVRRGEIGAVQSIWVRHFVGHGGDFYFKDWHAERRYTTSLLLQKAAHDIDVVHWLAGAYTERVSAFGDLRVYGRITDRRAPGEPPPYKLLSPERNWPPLAQRRLNHVIDVEDVSVINMVLAGGVLAAYQQCHFTPDYWRNYTVIGDAGRLENFGDRPGGVVKVWNACRSVYRADADREYPIPGAEGGHGGADPLILGEFLRFVREGGLTDTSPVAARMSVAAGVRATESLRSDGTPLDIPPLDPDLVAYFDRGQA